jgi:hypothetical protein
MIEIRYANELGGLSALEGKLTIDHNVYYIAGKNASFFDNRPRNELANGNLAEWKKHVNGDTNSIEANPSLNSEYVPTNPLCEEMGIQATLSPNYTWPIVAPTQQYNLVVNNGSGSGSYSEGQAISIVSDIAPVGKCFVIWVTDGISLNGIANPSLTFFMPANNVTITAEYRDLPENSYAINITANFGGTANANVTYAFKDDVITLDVQALQGYVFSSWQIVAGNVSITNDTFVMPEENVTIHAVFEKILNNSSTVTGDTWWKLLDGWVYAIAGLVSVIVIVGIVFFVKRLTH